MGWIRFLQIFAIAAVCLGCVFISDIRAGEADEEAAAERERLARDRKLAEEKARKAAEAAGKTLPPKKDDPAKTPPKIVEAPIPALPKLCPLCRGVGIVPLLPYRPYMKFEEQLPPVPDYPAAWQFCSACNPGIDAKASARKVSIEMDVRQGLAREKHKTFEDYAGKSLLQFETPFITVRSMLSPLQNRKVAEALEKCAGILQTNSKSMVTLSTRPDEDSIILILDEGTYFRYIESSLPPNSGGNAEMYKKGTGMFFPHAHMVSFGKPNGSPPENRATYCFGRMLMQNATDQKVKPWLVEGFGAYCENATLNMNTMYAVSYEFSTAKFSKNWNDDIKKLEYQGKLKPWGELFNIELEMLGASEYLHCYSITSFLIKSDPVRFDRFVLLLKDGVEAEPAIERAYGKRLKDLEAAWRQWVTVQK